MIVKNEEANLPGCLRSVADLVQEIIVVDTGSTDRTREIATSLGARVFDFRWVDDFAAARNASLQHATGEWIFWLDGDESLDEVNRDRLRAQFAALKVEHAAYVMQQHSISESSDDETIFAQVRLFPNTPFLRWRYRVHEQILPALEETGADIRWSPVVISHSGYLDPTTYRGKQERNLRLLNLQQAETPDDPLTLFNLGLTHYTLNRPTEAIQFWRDSLARSAPTSSLRRKLYALLAKSDLQMGRPQAAAEMIRTGLSHHSDDVELLSMHAALLAGRGDLCGAESCLRQILQNPSSSYFAASLDAGLLGYKTRHNLARLCRAQGRHAEAESHWRAALAERPGYQPALADLAGLLLEQQRWSELDDVIGRLESRPQGQSTAAQWRAHKHLARQDSGAALRTLEAAIRISPQSLELKVLLSRMLLRHSQDHTACEAALRDILTLDPYHLEARNNLTVLLRQLGRNTEPIPPALAEELFQLAESDFHAENYGDAAARYRPLLHANYRPGLMLYRLATVANQQEDFASAWELHQQALALDPALAGKIAPPESPHRTIICRSAYDAEPVDHCPVCNNTSQTPLMIVNALASDQYYASIHPVRRWMRCTDCGHAFANPRPTAHALREVHHDFVPVSHWTHEMVAKASDIVYELCRRRPGGCVLVVGAANAALAAVAVDYGCEVCAIDSRQRYAEDLGRLGVDFRAGDICTYDFGARQFDTIVLGDVLQYLPYPRQLMGKTAAILKPGGIIWLSTPNYEGAWTQALRSKDPTWLRASCLQFFSKRSLGRLLGQFGMQIIDYRLSKRNAGCAEVVVVPESEAP
jgi:tetratricopeptide (TPR) repeat protein/SAM-dependent methyltransferase